MHAFSLNGRSRYLTNWDQYLSPIAMRILGGNLHAFMRLDGAIEIVLGIGVAVKPRIFSYLVALWLLAIIVSLVSTGQYYDIAFRDAGLCLCAFALGRLSHSFQVTSHR